jgi:AcrR family transcriptional regulator
MLADANSKVESHHGRQRLSSAERRAAIVSTAVELFARHGFRGTTTRELASSVGVSEPVLYQHFATKGELYTAIVEHMVAHMTAMYSKSLVAMEQDADERLFLQRLGELILSFYLDETQHVRLLLFSALEGHDLAEIWHQRATVQFLRFVEDYIARRQAEGLFQGANSAIAARAFIGSVAHFGQVWAIYENPLPELSREQVVSQFVDLYLNGIRRPAVGGQQS